MGLIHGGDDIAKAIADYEASSREGYVHAQDRHIALLRTELAAERTAKLAAESLTNKYAAIIGEQKEALRKAATVHGITEAVRKLQAHQVSPGELGWLLSAVALLGDRMCKEAGWAEELEATVTDLQYAHLHCIDVQDEIDAVDVDEMPERFVEERQL